MDISLFGVLFVVFILIGLPIVVQIIANKVIRSYNRVEGLRKQSSSELVSFNLHN